MNLSAILLGLMMYIVFDTILLSTFDTIVLGQASLSVSEFLHADELRYTAYYAFIHALFYTAGFSVAYRMVMQSDTGIGTGFAVGIGCAGASAILDTARPMVSNLIAAFEINRIGADTFLANSEKETLESAAAAVKALQESSPVEYLFSGYEKILLVLVFISLGVIIHLAITHRASFYYLFAAMGMFFVTYIPSALYSTGYITSILLLEGLMTLTALACVGFAYVMIKKFGSNPLSY